MKPSTTPSSVETEHVVLAAILSAPSPAESRAILTHALAKLPPPFHAWFSDNFCQLMAWMLAKVASEDGDTLTESIAGHLAAVSADYSGCIPSGHGFERCRPVNEAGSLLDRITLARFIQIATTPVSSTALDANLAALRNLRLRRDMIDVMRQVAGDLQHAHPSATAASLMGPALGRLTSLSEPEQQGDGIAGLGEWIASVAAGKITPIPTPIPILAKMTRFSNPGSLVVLAADPGSGKSVLAQQIILHAQANGVPCAAFMLEESKTYWQRRALSQLARDSNASSPAWVARHGTEALELAARHAMALESFGRCLTTCPSAGITIPGVASWAEAQAASGMKLLLIDPLAVAQPTHPARLVTESESAVASLKRTADRHSAVVLLVTHPRKGTSNRPAGAEPMMDDLAGSAAIPRFSDVVMWLKAVEEDDQSQHVLDPETGSMRPAQINRIIKVLKARNGKGDKATMGLWFDGQALALEEVGLVVKQRKEGERKTKKKQAEDDAPTQQGPLF